MVENKYDGRKVISREEMSHCEEMGMCAAVEMILVLFEDGLRKPLGCWCTNCYRWFGESGMRSLLVSASSRVTPVLPDKEQLSE